jgi:hypothetical protein
MKFGPKKFVPNNDHIRVNSMWYRLRAFPKLENTSLFQSQCIEAKIQIFSFLCDFVFRFNTLTLNQGSIFKLRKCA